MMNLISPFSPRFFRALVVIGLCTTSLPKITAAMELTPTQGPYPSFPFNHLGDQFVKVEEGQYVPSASLYALCNTFKDFFQITEAQIKSLSLKDMTMLFRTHILREDIDSPVEYLRSDKAQAIFTFIQEEKHLLEVEDLLKKLNFFSEYSFREAVAQASGNISIGILNGPFLIFLNRIKFFLEGWAKEQTDPACKSKLDHALLLVLSGERKFSSKTHLTSIKKR